MARLPDKNSLSGPASLRSGRMISSADMSGIGRGLSSLGNSLAGIGREYEAEEEKTRKQETAVGIARAESYRDEQFLATQNEFEQDGDYTTFQSRAAEKTKKIVDDAAALIPDPEKRQLWLEQSRGNAARVNDWAADKARDARQQSNVNSLDEALEANRRIYVDPATSEEDKKKARADIEGAIGVAGEIGLLTPDGMAARKGKFIDGADVTRRELEAATYPERFIKQADGPIKSVVNRIIGNESSGDPNAQNSRSSAGGLGGFVDKTWVAAVRDYRPDLARGMSNDQIIEMKTDPNLAREMTTRHMQYNATELARARLPVTDGTVYLAHFAGLTGAKNILNAQDDTPVSTVLSEEAIRKNPEVLGGGKTVGDVKAWADRKMVGGAGGTVPKVQFIDATAGKIRDKPVQTWVKDGLARAAAATDSRIAIKIVSGGQDDKQRTGSKRHDHGNAADLILVVDGKEVKPSENKALYAAFFKNAAANGFKGLGHYEWGIHVGGGAQAAWGPDKSTRTLDPEFAKAAAEGWGNPAKAGSAPPPAQDYLANLSPEDRYRIQKIAEAEQNRRNVEMRSGIDVIVKNAPSAILNTGEYTGGDMPGPEQFFAAYGHEDGAERYNQFRSEVDTAEQAFSMKTMSADQIEAMVGEATPTSSGDDAAAESKRYETLSKAKEATMKAREADPAVYTFSAFPSVARAWQGAANPDGTPNPGGLEAAIAASVAAQQQLGIKNIQPLPQKYAQKAVETFKDVNLGEAQRLAAVGDVMMATPDPAQQRAIFNQMVKEGLPDFAEGALVALSRKDVGAARRLLQATLTDVSKLSIPDKPAAIKDQIQLQLMDDGQIGDVFYGLGAGVTVENLERAQRDNELLFKAVSVAIFNGKTLEAAIAQSSKDLYGDVKAVRGDGRVNAEILLPSKEDETVILDGLAAMLPEVEKALTERAIPNDAPTANGMRAVVSAATQNHNRNILSEGFFRSVDGGFVFINPYDEDGSAIEGPDGKPLVFTDEQVRSAKPALPDLLLTDQKRTMGDDVQTEMEMQEDRVRKLYEGAQ